MAAVTRLVGSAIVLAYLVAAQSFPSKPIKKEAAKAVLVSVRMIAGSAPHSAFTDLIRYRGRWYCAFREGAKHVSADGAIRILSSGDAEKWEPAALVSYPVADLRDPKLTVTPENQLMLTAAGAMHPPSDIRHKTFVWFSSDGREWGSAEMIGDPDVWLWRVQWNNGRAYGMGYSTVGDRFLRAYSSADGRKFDVWNGRVFDKEQPSETALAFLPDQTALCLLRRDGNPATAQLGKSRPPYRGWAWQDLGVRIGGPSLLRLADGRLIAGVRLYEGKQRTSLCWLDAEQGTLTEFLTLPSSGDSSYPGLVFHEDELYMSYYSSHEGHSSIYLARIRLPGF